MAANRPVTAVVVLVFLLIASAPARCDLIRWQIDVGFGDVGGVPGSSGWAASGPPNAAGNFVAVGMSRLISGVQSGPARIGTVQTAVGEAFVPGPPFLGMDVSGNYVLALLLTDEASHQRT